MESSAARVVGPDDAKFELEFARLRSAKAVLDGSRRCAAGLRDGRLRSSCRSGRRIVRGRTAPRQWATAARCRPAPASRSRRCGRSARRAASSSAAFARGRYGLGDRGSRPIRQGCAWPRSWPAAFRNATCRGRWLKPQELVTMVCSGASHLYLRMRAATVSPVSTLGSCTSTAPTPSCRLPSHALVMVRHVVLDQIGRAFDLADEIGLVAAESK